MSGTSGTTTAPIAIADLPQIRAHTPHRIAEALATRTPGRLPAPGERLMIIAADHPARGSLGAGPDAMAMADRTDLLGRITDALARPGVHGFLGTADLIEDLALLGALEGKLVFGSMNRGGLPGAVFEADDRFTGYDARGIAEAGLAGGKMLLRVAPAESGTAETLERCANAVNELADRELVSMVEPFWSYVENGRLRNDLSPEAVIRSIAVASGLGRTSARTWLKLPAVAEPERVMAATTMPSLILGGEVPEDPDAALASWQATLACPNVLGLVIGRTLLYPPNGDVGAAVDAATALL
ncbi:Cgl0159 family (beta/alpha)8-fold protein [Ruania halotolerans]|uniref:Cgl0159 family (beta/alpha)8-fold protein n=1 Tax=Ruania halotolerans TaxID=2897773 RepID=UPI001E58491A|nr:deoxyribose-phosphate aldolase [Ruania halotolerans]UFU06559.1 deoxyribose-phosphate aldolase [Ruania halotolerans]